MQATEKLTQLSQPQDVEIVQDFQELYGDMFVGGAYYADSENSGYRETNLGNITAGNYQRQCARLVDRLVEISGNEKFREISKYFEKFVMSGNSRKTQDNIKKLAEQIYFQMKQEKDRGVDVEANFAGIINNASFICAPGGFSNLQLISQSISASPDLMLFNAKYRYIQNLAGDYLSANKYVHKSMEIHEANRLIYAVKNIYNVQPPDDIYGHYALEHELEEGFQDYILEKFRTGEAAEAILDNISTDILQKFPDDPQMPEFSESRYDEITYSMKKAVESVLGEGSFNPEDFLEISDDYTSIAGFNPNYIEVLKMKLALKLEKDGLFSAVAQKSKDGLLVRFSDGLYSYKGDIVKKELDFNKLQDLRIDGMDLREYFALHTLVEANEDLNIAEKIDLFMVASGKRTALELQEQGYQINNIRDVLLFNSDVVTNVSKDSLQDEVLKALTEEDMPVFEGLCRQAIYTGMPLGNALLKAIIAYKDKEYFDVFLQAAETAVVKDRLFNELFLNQDGNVQNGDESIIYELIIAGKDPGALLDVLRVNYPDRALEVLQELRGFDDLDDYLYSILVTNEISSSLGKFIDTAAAVSSPEQFAEFISGIDLEEGKLALLTQMLSEGRDRDKQCFDHLLTTAQQKFKDHPQLLLEFLRGDKMQEEGLEFYFLNAPMLFYLGQYFEADELEEKLADISQEEQDMYTDRCRKFFELAATLPEEKFLELLIVGNQLSDSAEEFEEIDQVPKNIMETMLLQDSMPDVDENIKMQYWDRIIKEKVAVTLQIAAANLSKENFAKFIASSEQALNMSDGVLLKLPNAYYKWSSEKGMECQFTPFQLESIVINGRSLAKIMEENFARWEGGGFSIEGNLLELVNRCIGDNLVLQQKLKHLSVKNSLSLLSKDTKPLLERDFTPGFLLSDEYLAIEDKANFKNLVEEVGMNERDLQTMSQIDFENFISRKSLQYYKKALQGTDYDGLRKIFVMAAEEKNHAGMELILEKIPSDQLAAIIHANAMAKEYKPNLQHDEYRLTGNSGISWAVDHRDAKMLEQILTVAKQKLTHEQFIEVLASSGENNCSTLEGILLLEDRQSLKVFFDQCQDLSNTEFINLISQRDYEVMGVRSEIMDGLMGELKRRNVNAEQYHRLLANKSNSPFLRNEAGVKLTEQIFTDLLDQDVTAQQLYDLLAMQYNPNDLAENYYRSPFSILLEAKNFKLVQKVLDLAADTLTPEQLYNVLISAEKIGQPKTNPLLFKEYRQMLIDTAGKALTTEYFFAYNCGFRGNSEWIKEILHREYYDVDVEFDYTSTLDKISELYHEQEPKNNAQKVIKENIGKLYNDVKDMSLEYHDRSDELGMDSELAKFVSNNKNLKLMQTFVTEQLGPEPDAYYAGTEFDIHKCDLKLQSKLLKATKKLEEAHFQKYGLTNWQNFKIHFFSIFTLYQDFEKNKNYYLAQNKASETQDWQDLLDKLDKVSNEIKMFSLAESEEVSVQQDLDLTRNVEGSLTANLKVNPVRAQHPHDKVEISELLGALVVKKKTQKKKSRNSNLNKNISLLDRMKRGRKVSSQDASNKMGEHVKRATRRNLSSGLMK